MNKFLLILVSVSIAMSSCKTVPFFMSTEKVTARQEKKIAKLEKKKKKAQYKLDVAKGEGKRKIKKLEKIESQLPADTVVHGLDSASLAKEKAEVEAISLKKNRREQARKIMAASEIRYRSAKLKTKLKFLTGGNKQTITAHFRIEKDRAIWVNVTAVGMSVGRGLITPKRVQAFNRINKVYYDFSFDEIVKLINVVLDFNTLQAIIMGNAVGENGEVFELGDFGGTINIGIKSDEYLNKLTYNKSDSTLRQMQLQVFRGNYASNILGMLGDYKKELGRMISTKRVYNIEDSKGKLGLEMEIQKIDFDEDVRMPYKVPDGYKQVE